MPECFKSSGLRSHVLSRTRARSVEEDPRPLAITNHLHLQGKLSLPVFGRTGGRDSVVPEPWTGYPYSRRGIIPLDTGATAKILSSAAGD